MSDDNPSLEAAKRAVRRAGGREQPSAEQFVPEIRSNIKWKPSAAQVQPFRPEASTLVIWNFGVPFDQINGLHNWLDAAEVYISNQCQQLTQDKAHYLGTYLNLDSGSPRYQTFWSLSAAEDAEEALRAALQGNQTFRDTVAKLRGYWSRDPGASDQRVGLARLYRQISGHQNNGAFWQSTLDSTSQQPAP